MLQRNNAKMEGYGFETRSHNSILNVSKSYKRTIEEHGDIRFENEWI